MRVNPIAFPLICIATLSVLLGQAPKPATPLPGDWPMFSHDLSSTRYSPLTQISAKNVSKLTPAWTFRLRSDAEMSSAPGGGYSEITPLVINGVMYLTAGNRVLALNPETGKEIWKAPLPTSGAATPMTYRARPGGKQFVVIAAGGHSKVEEETQSDALIAFSLP